MRIATIFFNLLFIQIESGIQQRATQIAADFVRRIAVNFFTAIAATPETGTENKSFGLPSHRRRQPDCFDRLPSFLASRKPTCHVACRRRSRRLSSCKTLHLSIGCKTRFYYRTKSRKVRPSWVTHQVNSGQARSDPDCPQEAQRRVASSIQRELTSADAAV